MNLRTSSRSRAEIAKAVATSLELRLLGTEDDSAKNVATKSVEAHNAYLQGQFYFQRRNLEGYLKAVSFFDQAIQLDPAYALAYAERSEAWTWIGDLSSEKQKEAWSKAGPMARGLSRWSQILRRRTPPSAGLVFSPNGNSTEGLAELRRAQQLAPWNPTE